MTMSPNRETAKIYVFPPRGRFETAARGKEVRHDPQRGLHPVMECGAGWYHDAAVREAASERKHGGE